MSLLLCRQEPVKNPYYIDVLDVHIYSSQELCYVIFNHPLLVMDEFVDSSLLDFIRRELALPGLADRMEKLAETGSRPEEILTLFLLECDYYTEKEVQQFKAAAASYRRLPAGEYEKARADYLFGKRQYGRAAARYEKVLEMTEGSQEQEAFRARIYNNLGASYAQMFQFHKALATYERAYELREDKDVLKRIYFLSRFAPELEIKKIFSSQMVMLNKIHFIFSKNSFCCFLSSFQQIYRIVYSSSMYPDIRLIFCTCHMADCPDFFFQFFPHSL